MLFNVMFAALELMLLILGILVVYLIKELNLNPALSWIYFEAIQISVCLNQVNSIPQWLNSV